MVRNDKKGALCEKWIPKATKQIYSKMNNTRQSNPKYRQVCHNFLENLQKDVVKRSVWEHPGTNRKPWNFIDETRGSIKTSLSMKSLKNFIGELITDENKVTSFLNYQFFSHGSCFVPSRPCVNISSALPINQIFPSSPSLNTAV